MGLHVADAHRVAVGRGMRDAADADGAAGAADVLDDNGLAERCLHPLRQEARDGVGRPAGRIGHDDGDDVRRIALRLCVERARRKQGEGKCNHFAHGCLLRVGVAAFLRGRARRGTSYIKSAGVKPTPGRGGCGPCRM